jgi:hypothetical protein
MNKERVGERPALLLLVSTSKNFPNPWAQRKMTRPLLQVQSEAGKVEQTLLRF